MKRKVDLKEIDPAGLAGVGDKNLKILEDSFNCKIILRGTTINLEGDKSIIFQAEETINEMMKTYSRKNHLSVDDVQSLLALVSNGETIASSTNNSTILHTTKGPITPRSEGQKKFLSLVDKDDMVFAIGPAGTGKTFLAVAFAIAAYKSRRVEKIVLSRPAVEAGERLGFLPGDLKEKIDPYLAPLYDSLSDLMLQKALVLHH